MMSNGILVAERSGVGAVASTPSRIASVARRVHRFLNGAVLVAVPLQFYAAGLAVFGASSFGVHTQLGRAILPLSLLSLIAAIIGRKSGARPWLSALLFLLMFLQPVLAFAPRASAPAVSALHSVVGLLIAAVAWQIELGLRRPS